MAKAGATIGGLIGLLITFMIVSLPTGLEGIEGVANQNSSGNLKDYVDSWTQFLVVFFIVGTISSLIGAALEEFAKKFQ